MRIYIKVIPRSSRNKIEKINEHEYKAWVAAPPVDSKANDKLILVLADYFKVSRTRISIVGGKTSRKKIVDIISS